MLHWHDPQKVNKNKAKSDLSRVNKLERIICGGITLFRLQCPECGEMNLSGTTIFACSDCKNNYQYNIVNNTRVLSGTTKRKQLSKKMINEMIEKQDHKCFYCQNSFGVLYERNNKVRTLSPHADHWLPYSYLKSNPDDNWVIACSICNLWKSAKMFETIDDCKKYLSHKWAKELDLNKIQFIK